MRSHLEDDVLLDVLEGAASGEATRHAAECAPCGTRLAEARAGLSLAALAEAPEPSPLYWDLFRRRVVTAIGAEPQPRRFGRLFAPALLTAVAMVAVVSFLSHDQAPLPGSPAPLAASSALPVIDDAGVDAAAVEDLGCRDVAACVAGLTDDESRALADALRAELAESGDL